MTRRTTPLMRRRWSVVKWTGMAIAGFIVVTMLCFRGDWRVFTGFDLLLSDSTSIHFHTGDWDAIDKGDLVRTVHVTKVSDRYTLGGNPHVGDEEAVETVIGPTVIVLRSGKVVIAGGVSYMQSVRDGRSYNYIQVE